MSHYSLDKELLFRRVLRYTHRDVLFVLELSEISTSK